MVRSRDRANPVSFVCEAEPSGAPCRHAVKLRPPICRGRVIPERAQGAAASFKRSTLACLFHSCLDTTTATHAHENDAQAGARERAHITTQSVSVRDTDRVVTRREGEEEATSSSLQILRLRRLLWRRGLALKGKDVFLWNDLILAHVAQARMYTLDQGG